MYVDEKINKMIRLETGMSLFSGCGGDTLGMEQSGIDVRFFTEIDPVIQETHIANFPKSKLIGSGNMTEITDDEFGRYRDQVDIIFAGFPCQGFSNAGKKKTGDTRNSLFHHFVRCVGRVRPKVIIGENVKGLLSRKNDKNQPYIESIRDEFQKIGYRIAWKLYNCEKIIPQIRQRLIIVGVREDIPHNPWYLLPDISPDIPDKNLLDILRYSPHGAIPFQEGDIDLTLLPDACFVRQEDEEESYCRADPPHPYMLLKKNARGSIYPIPDGKMFPGGLISFAKRNSPIHAEVMDRSRPSKTIICTYENQPRLYVPQKTRDNVPTIRCLSIDELKQIQGFPIDFKLCGNRKQQIHMIGNAAPPPLVSFLVRSIQERLQTRHPFHGFRRQELFDKIFDAFQKTLSGSATVKRDTQAIEREYSDIFSGVLRDLDLCHIKAGSQQPIDYIILHPSDPSLDIPIELKRTSGTTIKCNDTYPEKDVYYIIIHEKKGVRWRIGQDLVVCIDEKMQKEYDDKIKDLRTAYSKNGNISMYARPNFSINISHIFA